LRRPVSATATTFNLIENGYKQLRDSEYLVVISNEKGDLLSEYRLRSDTCGVGES
jgi:hypothetical protein